MKTNCPHCDIEIEHGETTCPNCLGSIRYQYMTGPSHGRVKTKKEKLLVAFFAWLLSFGALWWLGDKVYGEANLKVCFWLSLVAVFYMLVIPRAEKDI